MNLGHLIKYLEKEDPELIIPIGFNNPHICRISNNLCFDRVDLISVAEMLRAAKSILGQPFINFFGSHDVVLPTASVKLEGPIETETIGPILLHYMIASGFRELFEYSGKGKETQDSS